MIETAMNFKHGIMSTLGLPEKAPVHHSRDGAWSGQGEVPEVKTDTEKGSRFCPRVSASPRLSITLSALGASGVLDRYYRHDLYSNIV